MNKTIDKEISKFMKAIHDYNLFEETELIRYAMITFFLTKKYNFNDAEKNYQNFWRVVRVSNLNGTNDLFEPINNIFYIYIRPELSYEFSSDFS